MKRTEPLEVCRTCKTRPVDTSRSLIRCTECLDAELERVKGYVARKSDVVKLMDKKHSTRYYSLHKNEVRARQQARVKFRKENGLCVRCGKFPIDFTKSDACCSNCYIIYYRYSHKRRLKMDALEHFSYDEWDDVCKSFGNRCLWCGRDDVKLTVDHVIPISRDGTDLIKNVQPLCGNCNGRKGTKIIDFRPFGNIIMEWT